MLAPRDAVPRHTPLAWSELATLRQKLLMIGARVIAKAARVRTIDVADVPVWIGEMRPIRNPGDVLPPPRSG